MTKRGTSGLSNSASTREGLSLDGVAEIDASWHFPYFGDNMSRAVSHDYNGVDVLLLGRVTYESFAGAWPGREAAGEEDAAFARALGDMRKVVVSRQRLEFTWRNLELLERRPATTG